MASVFKSPGAKNWTINYTDEHGKRRKKAGYPDKKRTDLQAARLELRAREIRDGLADPKAERFRDHEGILLVEHLKDYERSMIADGCTPKHVAQTIAHIKRMLELAKASRISDLTLSPFLEAVQGLRDQGLSRSTINHGIVAVKSFSRWLKQDKRDREYSLEHLATSDAESDRRHVRRYLSPEEVAGIIRAAEHGPDVLGLSGPERAILYALAAGTGFRANELRTLTRERFHVDSDQPVIIAKAAYTKNKREARQPIARSLADRLRPWLSSKAHGEPVFGDMTDRTAEMLRVDLKAAGIPYETDSGVADFHSLRGDFISYLVSSGASVKVCQTLARHSDPSLTIGTYAKASLHDISGAVESLPDLTAPKPQHEALRSTGTDGRPENTTFRGRYDQGDSAQPEVLQMDRADFGPRSQVTDYPMHLPGNEVVVPWRERRKKRARAALSRESSALICRSQEAVIERCGQPRR